jgi:hypothetical protein
MVYDLSPGDVIHIGDTVTLTVVAVERNLFRIGLESPDGGHPDADTDCREADPKQGWWELN